MPWFGNMGGHQAFWNSTWVGAAKAKVISKENEERDSERELLFHKEARRESELSR